MNQQLFPAPGESVTLVNNGDLLSDAKPAADILGTLIKNGGGETLLIPESELRTVEGFGDGPNCLRCDMPFRPRKRSGGKPQKFCSEECRRAYKPNAGQCEPTPAQRETLPAVVVPAAKKAASADDDLDWSTATLPEQFATKIYFNNEGELVICQRRWPDENQYVFIGADTIQTFLDKLTDACGIGSAG